MINTGFRPWHVCCCWLVNDAHCKWCVCVCVELGWSGLSMCTGSHVRATPFQCLQSIRLASDLPAPLASWPTLHPPVIHVHCCAKVLEHLCVALASQQLGLLCVGVLEWQKDRLGLSAGRMRGGSEGQGRGACRNEMPGVWWTMFTKDVPHRRHGGVL